MDKALKINEVSETERLSEANLNPPENVMRIARQQIEGNLNVDKIKTIEKIKTGAGQLAEVVLVILGLKPSTELDIYKWNEDPKEVKRKLEEAGLIVKEKKISEWQKSNVSASFAVSRDSGTMDRLLNAEANKDHEEYGRLMGYPETAIQAFLDRSKLLPTEEYPDMKGIVFSFKMSKDNYDEELNVLRKWSEAIKKYAPNLYKELIR